MSEAEEVAKAVQESAKLGNKGLDVAQRAGTFFVKVFEGPIEEIAGIVGDKLRFVRWKQMVRMADEVDQILAHRGISETRPVPLKLALPIIEHASIEDDPDLQRLWNNLLANAMDPNFDAEIRYGFVEMISQIDSTEAQMLDQFYNFFDDEGLLSSFADVARNGIGKSLFIEVLNINEDQYVLAANNLMRLRLLCPAVFRREIDTEGTLVFDYQDIQAIAITALGVKFVEACRNAG